MQKFRWAYIGSGNIAESTAKSILKGNHQIVSVFGRNQAKVKAFAEKYSADACTDFDSAVDRDDVDGVYIATPHTSHVDYAIRAMRLGKPVLCEKPVGVSLEDVDTLIDEAKNNNVYFCEAMWTWFSDVALTVKNWVQSGEIGEIENVVINYAFPGILMPKNSRVLLPETAGGALLDIGIYPITYCYNLFGVPNKIHCSGKIKNGIDISETVVLEYGNLKCTLNMSLCSLKEDCTIVGSHGTIKLPMFFHMASKAILQNRSGKTVFNGKTDYLTEFTRAAEEIRRGRKESAYIPFEATRECMKIMDECRRQMDLVYPFEEE
ncbi:MAG: Gfo/Idh/MocA family oxidoreductase [Faecalibacterium sp.]|nr:Gfo/Idh/MocA family oxidoreductase [Ruminococcus sp.]MCM1392319.1 Gfo/Idh/MocA family oxidoreductase [Ruminococcus sp.]MCM1486056.1 Gfo/Idh/MocA family oxidoreductase [Faecalibacterium sp.]